ncbi:hypothetical protein EPA93_26520 [Ktedonosporobacter rubrisoli]|uniref:DUF4878 domain-containing protein n=1 Tax=Ktedonosporobacter rubrisoli TaxID=2509675 RepID=A0A4P6JVI8_KTERU|nr:hypothetical protein [Ktedonosporobacter rubrisoli]QBD79350.1 hypothetical protein EPA93_26520 [Ktedonosporobacter rubrisoli]
MQDPNHSSYDQQGYDDVSSLPYIPDESTPRNKPVPSNEGAEVTQPAQNTAEVHPQVAPAAQAAQAAIEHTVAVPPPAPASGTALAKPQRTLSRSFLITAGIVVAILIIAPIVTYQILAYANRSTPTKTLDAFCTALQHEDYQQAYNQFSKNLQNQFSEMDFANALAPDKVVSCVHGSASESDTSSVTSLRLIHDSKGVNQELVTLKKDENNVWKIDDLQVAA